jgi:cytochrome c
MSVFTTKKLIVVTAGTLSAAAMLTGILTGQQPQLATAPFTQAQADAGRPAYQTACAACHGPDLGGRNDASQLAGSLFMGSWGNRTTADLVGFMQAAMPPGNAGRLDEATYLNIAAFILDSNGARPGAEALTTNACLLYT